MDPHDDDESTEDENTASRSMGRNTMMVSLEEQKALTERARIKAGAVKASADAAKDQSEDDKDVELARIASDERKALWSLVGKIVGGVLLIAGISLAAYWATQGVPITVEKGDAKITVGEPAAD